MIREFAGAFVVAAFSVGLAAPAAAGESRYEYCNEAMAKDRKQFEKEAAERAPMREAMDSIELLELRLK